MPMQWGKVKVVPYLLGEFAYWGEDINHQSATRTFGQVGVRDNLPMSRTDTEIQSTLFNVNGVSHKVNWTVDAYWADASEELTLFLVMTRWMMMPRNTFDGDSFLTPLEDSQGKILAPSGMNGYLPTVRICRVRLLRL